MSSTLNRIAAKTLCTLALAMLTFAVVRADDPVPDPSTDEPVFGINCLFASCKTDGDGNYEVGKACGGVYTGTCTCYKLGKDKYGCQ
ncbi:hypothetical protein R5W23_002867 [Gemmata sp. JC673]|uniref:Uncharacterized protein n=1 Tax=Gemmata algarum TaxID=2975278 RepID=A0ABU5F322_9BACT|nr:hypothetical protein [Gemmata algarum]MDY3561589.1 hypothetical protein [Gemmata algarum]